MEEDKLQAFLDSCADAVRERSGTTEEILGSDIPNKIRSIPGGSGGGLTEEEADARYLRLVDGRIVELLNLDKNSGITFSQIVTGNMGSKRLISSNSKILILEGNADTLTPDEEKVVNPTVQFIDGEIFRYSVQELIGLMGAVSCAGDIYMNQHQIRNLKDPSIEYDAANKKYVDSKFDAANSQGVIYSTEEMLVGKWVNNEPLFQITFVGRTGAGGLFPEISIPGVQTYVSTSGWIVRNDNYEYQIPSFISANDYIACSVSPGDKTRFIFFIAPATQQVIKNADFHMTIQYTKTSNKTDFESPKLIMETEDYMQSSAITNNL